MSKLNIGKQWKPPLIYGSNSNVVLTKGQKKFSLDNPQLINSLKEDLNFLCQGPTRFDFLSPQKKEIKLFSRLAVKTKQRQWQKLFLLLI
jgi:hypothetical protein